MANNNFMKTTLSLTSPICMDINDNVVRPFDSFNKKNAPFIGDQLSPFYVEKDKAVDGEVTPVYDEQGNRWSLINNKLCKNGVAIQDSPTFENSYSKTKTNKIYIYQSHFFNSDDVEIYIKDGFYYFHAITTKGDEIEKKITKAYENDIYGIETASNYYFAIYRSHLEDKALYVYRIKNTTYDIKEIKKDYTFSHSNGFINVVYCGGGFVGISLISEMGSGLRHVSWENFMLINATSETPELVSITPDNTTFEKNEESTLSQFYKNFIFLPGSEVLGFPRLGFIGQYYDAKWANPQPEMEDVIYVYESLSLLNIKYTQETFTLAVFNTCYDYPFHNYKEPLEDLKKSIANSFNLFPGIYEQNTVSSIKVGDKTDFYTWRFSDGYMYQMGGVELDSPSLTEDSKITYTVPSVLEKGQFFITFNSGYVSNVISKNQNLIIPWNEIIDFPMVANHGDYFCYKDKNKDYYLVKKDKLPKIKTIVNNRYILVESDSFYNAYDIKKEKWEKWSIGYNGALNFGYRSAFNIYVPLFPITRFTPEPVISIASGINANYEVSENPFFSSIFPAVRLVGYYGINGGFIASKLVSDYLDIDVYQSSTNSIIPKYRFSLRENVSSGSYVNTTLLDLYYPESSNIIYSVSLMSKFIKSYNNHDFIIEGDKAYPFLYSNNHIVFGYTALSFVENIKGAFVIQNSNYLLFDNKILSVQYNNGFIGASTIVADVTGMKFIGNTSQVAFFFSKLAKKIYTFTGDVVLREQRGANVIDEVYKTFFVPADNTIIMSCREHDGVETAYFFGNDSFLRLKSPKINDCYFGDNKIILVDDKGNTIKYSYFKTPNGKKLPIELQTGYFGVGNEMSSVIDCWYIRIFDEERGSGNVTVQQNTLTNVGAKTESKTIHINPGDWDKQTNSYLIRYQPRYQNGVGVQLNLTSDFAVYEIVVSSRQGETQLTSPKAQI